MASRFKASKYKNAAPMEVKKEEHIKDLAIGSYNSCGNYIDASAKFMAFNWDTHGAALAILPLDAQGRQERSQVPRINAHSEMVTDFAFSPHDDGVIASGSQDGTVKVFRVPSDLFSGNPMETNMDTPLVSLPEQARRIETVSWHPTADLVLASSSGTSINVWDLATSASLYSWDGHEDWVQGTDWQRCGGLLASQCKDKMLRVFDPRTGGGPTQEIASHDGMKDSKVVWVGEQRIMTSGFSGDRARQLLLRDLRNPKVVQNELNLDVSSGILIPLYDPDTNMVILAGKGDRYMQFVEVTESHPWFVPGLRYTGEQTKGACILPKRAMDVMKGEVVRVLQLADSSIVPVPWIVPRKTYRDFHADIFPDTASAEPLMGPGGWASGGRGCSSTVSLNPDNNSGDLSRFDTSDFAGRKYSAGNGDKAGSGKATATPSQGSLKKAEVKKDKQEFTVKMREGDSFLMPQIRPKSAVAPANPRASKFGRTTKFKHFKGTTRAKSEMFENLKNLSKSMASECDLIKANIDRVAIPLAGPGGKLVVFETAKAGRLTDGVYPSFINGGTFLDFDFDPFNSHRLVCANEDGTVKVWVVPEGGLVEQVNEPTSTFAAHGDKVSIVKFHPTAEGILATAAYDFTIKIWNLADTKAETHSLDGHEDQIFSFAWSQCGRHIASACKDGKIRIYSPRRSTNPMVEGGTVVPKKGARIVWTNDGEFLVVTGFSKQSERTISVYRSKDLELLHTEVGNVSPSILVPFYDEDSSTLFLAGKGENVINAYEVGLDHPHLHPLSPYNAPGLTQGYGWITNKSAMNVREVEFARAYRLTMTSIEPVSFTVPRVKAACFQDDLFPPTRNLWKPTVTAAKWLAGEDGTQEWVSLQPEDMRTLSGQAQNVAASSRPAKAAAGPIRKSVKEQTKTLNEQVGGMIETSGELEQDNMEGVSSKDWDD